MKISRAISLILSPNQSRKQLLDLVGSPFIVQGPFIRLSTCAVLGSIVVSISACHAEDPGSIPGRGGYFWFLFFSFTHLFSSNDMIIGIAYSLHVSCNAVSHRLVIGLHSSFTSQI